VADVELIREAVRALPSETRSYVVSRAADQVKAMQRSAPGWTAPYDLAELGEATFDRICDQLANLPCPCLDPEGRCLIYRSRPLVCRMMGLGMMTESGDPIDNACPIQHDYPDYAALEPRPFPLRDFEIEEDGAKIAAADRILGGAGRAGFETTIAGAITGAEDR
jgi:Fe-S-cluster containining protein